MSVVASIAFSVGKVEAAGLPALWIQALAVDPTDSAVVYAGTPTGIYKTTDAGENWARIDSNLPYPDVSSLAINPAAPCTIYAGLDSHLENRLIRFFPTPQFEIRNTSDLLVVSTDCGATWMLAPNWTGRSVFSLAFTSATPPVLMARVTVNSLAGSLPALVDDIVQFTPVPTKVFTDGGGGAVGNRSVLATDPADPCVAYVAHDFGAVWTTSSCTALPWSRIVVLQPPGIQLHVKTMVVHPSDHSLLVGTYDQSLVCCESGGGIYRTTAVGDWATVLVAPEAINSFAFVPGRGHVAYAAGNGGTLYKSIDGGATWGAARSFGASLSIVAVGATPLFRGYAGGFGAVGLFGCHTGVDDDVTIAPDCEFTDPLLTPMAVTIKAVHIAELRVRIDRLRARYALPAVTWTDADLTIGVTPVRAQHLLDLRAALAGVYDAASQPEPNYTDSDLSAGIVAKGAHILELRRALEVLE